MPENRKGGGWPAKPLRELAQVVSGGTPSRYVGEFWEDGTIPWVTPTDLTNTPGRLLSDTREKITYQGLASCSATLLPAGTLLMTSRATLGEIRVAEREVCTNQGFKSLVPLPGTNGLFLYYQMLQNKERYRALGIGSTFLEVNKRDTERFEVLVPPDYSDQQRIAEILSTVDEAIEQTEALIAKTQQIKAGLMHDLFTRGVTAHGQLRPPREEAPQLYKESPLGWIPKEWDVSAGDELTTLITKGESPGWQGFAYQESGVIFVTSENVRDGYLDVSRPKFIPAALTTYQFSMGTKKGGRGCAH
jgi:type I restriction enzyme, S subunit